MTVFALWLHLWKWPQNSTVSECVGPFHVDFSSKAMKFVDVSTCEIFVELRISSPGLWVSSIATVLLYKKWCLQWATDLAYLRCLL